MTSRQVLLGTYVALILFLVVGAAAGPHFQRWLPSAWIGRWMSLGVSWIPLVPASLTPDMREWPEPCVMLTTWGFALIYICLLLWPLPALAWKRELALRWWFHLLMVAHAALLIWLASVGNWFYWAAISAGGV